MNLAAHAARWAAANWKKAAFGWLGFVLAAAALGQAVGVVTIRESEQGSGASARAQATLERAGVDQAANESVLVRSDTLTVGEPAFASVVERVSRRVAATGQVEDVRSPLRTGERGQISKDRHSALVQFSIRGSSRTAEDRVQPVLDAVALVQRRSPGFTVAEFGEASADRALSQVNGQGFARAEKLSVPITFMIMLAAFGAFVAAGIPVLLAFSAVLAAVGLAALASHLVPQAEATSSVMLLMGMAVGVDYSLFYIRREREERRRGHTSAVALGRAAATSGRAVLVSGLTVMIAMAGMLLTGTGVFTSLGVGAMLVVFAAVLGSLTVLPALLGRLGDKVEKGALVRARERRAHPQLWGRVLGPVLAHPRLAVALSSAALVLLALPALKLHTSFLSAGDMPRGLPIAATYEEIQDAFPGAAQPAQVVVSAADVDSPRVRRGLAEMERRALASGEASGPITTRVNRAHTVAEVDIPQPGNGQDEASKKALETLRGRVLPATLGRISGVGYAVGGEAASTSDFNRALKAHAPLVFGFVLGLAFVLLLIAFRSLVIPLTSIALNLLSVGAAYGVLVWVFQEGHLQGPLGFHSSGAVVAWIPLFLFPVLFGLSMDYHVFIVSRIKELRDGGATTSEAVARGIASSAGTVTAAAAVMVAVFAIFASLPTLDIKQLGVGLAVAVLLDATVVRCVLLPATMKLLGEWNWYLPRWLGRLAHVRGRPSAMGGVAEAA
ncbi:MAG TPA: MMPL family transporter [Solirubrobacteraceae bacterium]|nr:MMPL family transporter [Solirubrobacteraceae bacterium]